MGDKIIWLIYLIVASYTTKSLLSIFQCIKYMGGFPVGCRMSPTPAEHKTTKRKRTIFRDLSSADCPTSIAAKKDN